jgi:uncharacterized membrane protein YdcZ (DUF606 family)
LSCLYLSRHLQAFYFRNQSSWWAFVMGIFATFIIFKRKYHMSFITCNVHMCVHLHTYTYMPIHAHIKIY